jgi:outer membrane lipoprotein-sorting protein
MEVKGVEEVAGEKAYHLVFVPKGGGNAIDAWYSVESGLQLKTASTQETPMGEVKFENQLQDYKAIGEDGKLKQPHKIVTTGGGAEYIVTLEKVETNVELPADRFNPPAEVKQLMEQQEAAAQN